MKNFYRDGQVMPGGDGSGERSPTPQVAVPRTAAIDLSTARTYSLVKFNSYRKRGKAGSPPATTSNPYNVLKRVDWLAIFSPWAIINRSKMYAMTTKQNTCTTRTPAKNVALKGFLRRAPLRSGLAIVRGSTTVLPNIFMVRRAHHDIKPNTYATRTPANNAALKGLAIAKGGTTVVPNIFSGEFMEDGSFLSASMSSLRSVWTLLRSNCEAIIHAIEKPTIMDNVSCLACPTTGGSGIEDGKPVRRERRGNELNRFHTPFSSTLHLLLPLFFVSVFICFSGAAKAQSRQDVGAAEAVSVAEVQSQADSTNRPVDLVSTGLQIGDKVPDVLIQNLYNYKTGEARLSDFKGKLLIIDFWATWCAPCVAMIPRMDSLQKQFGDRIQFLSVTYQSDKGVIPFLERFEKQRNKKYNTPYVTDDSQLQALFPHRTLPHYVWIDGDGIVKAITSSKDINAANISKALDGRLAVVQKRDMKIPYERNKPFLINGNGGDGHSLIYHALLSGYTEGLPSAYTLSCSARHGFNGINATNMTLLQLYRLAYRVDGKYFGWNRTIITTRDSLYLRPPKGTKGADFRAWMNRGNGFCYAASSTRDSLNVLFERMRADLCRLFPQYKVDIREKEIECLVLLRTSDKDKVATKGGPVKHEFGNGCRLQNSSLDVLTSRLEIIYLQNQPYPVINGSGYTGAVDIVLDADLTDLGQLNAALAGYDLALKVETRSTYVLEIDDVS